MVICLMNTGIFTSLASILLAAFVLSGVGQAVIVLGECYGSLYIIAILSLLHSRAYLQEAPAATSKVQLGPMGAKVWSVRPSSCLDLIIQLRQGAVVVAIARETRRASFHNGDAEIAVWSRIESRYPHMESRTYQNMVSDLDKRGDPGQIEERVIVEVPET
ncbi:hypothetical protein BS47DRAFT_724467 [Hydnum rufescens UP504]|uniref:Uncharacterized protein n=1 Tax=Hydnum rufescens UP504 TaxID=1448309 RepID=A0A9P6B1W9_9AGAM|nr:hypothetical protein BS47DRAFT_724467 [Hydnum rufescens UP504]